MQNNSRPGTVRDTRDREREDKRGWAEKSLRLTMFVKDKNVKSTPRIWKWEIINQTFDISGIWPLLNWSPVFNYTTGLSSITVKRGNHKPPQQLFPWQIPIFCFSLSVALKRNRFIMSGWHSLICDLAWRVTSPVQSTSLAFITGREIKIYSIPTEWENCTCFFFPVFIHNS